jgi:hypothetical protein
MNFNYDHELENDTQEWREHQVSSKKMTGHIEIARNDLEVWRLAPDLPKVNKLFATFNSEED